MLTPILAHVGHSLGGFSDGFLHPLTGLDHLLAMVAVGVVAAAGLRGRAAWTAPGAFLGGMATGGVLGIAGVPLPGAELLIAASVLLLGVAIAGAVRVPGRWVLPLLAAAGVAHGHAHGAEAPTAAHPAVYVLGFLMATASLHAAGFGVGDAVRERRIVRFGIGAATAAAGAALLF